MFKFHMRTVNRKTSSGFLNFKKLIFCVSCEAYYLLYFRKNFRKLKFKILWVYL